MQRMCSHLFIAQRSMAAEKKPGTVHRSRLFSIWPSRPLRGRRPVIPLRGAPTGRKLERELSPAADGTGNNCAKTDVPQCPPHNFPLCAAAPQTMWKFSGLKSGLTATSSTVWNYFHKKRGRFGRICGNSFRRLWSRLSGKWGTSAASFDKS